MTFFPFKYCTVRHLGGKGLLVREAGLALLGESSHAFLLILGSEQALEETALESGSLLEVEFEGCRSRTKTTNRQRRKKNRERRFRQYETTLS